ncbi:sugar ABC transporter ATP-binding protein [Arthrobacter sp. GN70]|uniref:Sugar ABC transporter ATP-binding protein n=2 Tax=Arthrobacter TaxID=1663 RepID=A0A4V2ZSA9_9MICC|nr:sugar ABC transporter ATP-binding protein [Arthrobacter sp. GN70]TDF92494.1 sugar ABC transporter ATP-binding protein [Arthrobacter terricola]
MDPALPAGAPALERVHFQDMTVDFGATRAVDNFSLAMLPGEIVGLLGHNGAGKSTVLNVATGAVAPTGGSFAVDGVEVPRGSSPRAFAELGVTVVHQEPALAKNLSVFDNLELGRSRKGGRDARRHTARAVLSKVGAGIDLDRPVSTLSLGQRQLVDLARGVMEGEIKVLLLDEPTAALGAQETAALHGLIREFAAAGTAVIYVSHRLPDILDVCTRIVVMSGGRQIIDRPAAGITARDLAQALAPGISKPELTDTSKDKTAIELPFGSSRIQARTGEVVGLFGMASGEQFSLLEDLYGVGRPMTGVLLDGEAYQPAKPLDALRRGIHYVPADRERDGLLPTVSAKMNVLLPWLSHMGAGWWVGGAGKGMYSGSRNELNVHGPTGEEPIAEFSGGNRQKHLLARWMFPKRPRLLLLAQPTQGVDFGAKVDIVRALRRLAAEGTTALVASAESDEIASMCDRSYVIYKDRLRELRGQKVSDENLLESLLSLAAGNEPDPTTVPFKDSDRKQLP